MFISKLLDSSSFSKPPSIEKDDKVYHFKKFIKEKCQFRILIFS